MSKLSDSINQHFSDPYSAEFRYDDADERVQRVITQGIRKGGRLHKVYQFSGVTNKKNNGNDQLGF